MKKLFLLSATAILLYYSANAQTQSTIQKEIAVNKTLKKDDKKLGDKEQLQSERRKLRELRSKEVSDASIQAFGVDFGTINGASWRRGPYFDEVTFITKGTTKTAYYDIDAELVGTTQAKTFADLPKTAQNTIDKQYADYTKENVIFFDDNESNDDNFIYYDADFDDNEDQYFIELKKDNKSIVLRVDPDGVVSFFKEL